MKTCSHCGETKPLGDFHRNPRTRDKLTVWCKPCNCARTKAWNAANPERKKAADRAWKAANRDRKLATDRARYAQNKSAYRSYRLEKRFGVSLEEYDALLEQQNGVCAICGDPPGERRLAVDHCHKTGQVRGLLCGPCNSGLGHLKDDPERVEKALAYLRRST